MHAHNKGNTLSIVWCVQRISGCIEGVKLIAIKATSVYLDESSMGLCLHYLEHVWPDTVCERKHYHWKSA